MTDLMAPPDLKEPSSKICHARSKSTGIQCQRQAIPGGTVCRYHGGGAPQVQRAAKERLREMLDPALNALAHLVENAENETVRLRAAQDIMDRCGLNMIHKVDANVRVYDSREELVERAKEILAAELTEDES